VDYAVSRPVVVTFGCRLNTFESEVMRRKVLASGRGDAVIVNTCAVTSEAVRQARQAIRRLRREHPQRKIIVTGCAAQIDPSSFAVMPEVDQVLGNVDKLDPEHFAHGRAVVVSDVMDRSAAEPPLLHGFEGRTRAFVQIQQGCDHRCTFCIIPFARGPSRSVAPARVIAQVQRLVDNGSAEIVLTGVDLCSYGRDLTGAPTLGQLTKAVLAAVPALPRLRLSSLDPAAVDDDLFQVLAEEPRLMPHLHLSLQAADDLILKRMKRRHSYADALVLAERARRARADVVFGADLIAGFPSETDAMFERTLAAVDGLGLTYLHVFPYSPRPGTPAARMPQVPVPVRRERAARLRQAGEEARRRFFISRLGAETMVLIEQGRRGRCPHYALVDVDVDSPPGSILSVRITGASADHLIAESLT
jgi:threonylcarbamoyladenosine tRNA methylthiotransferase MtaB